MKDRTFRFVFCITAVLLLAGPLAAHHGLAAYDSRIITLVGTVEDFQFIQPHPVITVDVKDEDGRIVKWTVEMASPNHLVRYGWNGHKLKPGDPVTITGNPAKNGSNQLSLRKISRRGEDIPLGPVPEPPRATGW